MGRWLENDRKLAHFYRLTFSHPGEMKLHPMAGLLTYASIYQLLIVNTE